ncbi:MAG: DUF4105 domain-containing protein [Bdellovibrionales bacterium]|nr:DUF4105 domain-containing protein [Bdellovibrionales bacterium]
MILALGLFSLAIATSQGLAAEEAILSDPIFLGISGFDGRPIAIGSKNGRIARHPEGASADSSKAYLSAHLRKFREDPEYPCRFPAHFRYFKKVFGSAPAVTCQAETKVKLGGPVGQTFVVDLNPSRILEVRLMYASHGKDLPSRWGHLMLHLVVCPGAMPVGPECRKATDSHIVVSFRGQVDDPKVDNWKGVTGQYRLLPYFFRLPKSIREYTYEQGRTLTSYAIRLSAEQKDFFVERLLESFWAYDSGYNFLTRNCSTEIQDLLGTIALDQPQRKPYSRNYTPDRVLKSLLDSGILDQNPDQLIFFESAEKQVENFLREAGYPGGAAQYLEASPEERKAGLGSKALAQEKVRLAEDLALARAERKLQKQRLSAIQERLKTDPRAKDDLPWAWQQFPGRRTGSGYGVPLRGDPTYQDDEFKNVR